MIRPESGINTYALKGVIYHTTTAEKPTVQRTFKHRFSR